MSLFPVSRFFGVLRDFRDFVRFPLFSANSADFQIPLETAPVAPPTQNHQYSLRNIDSFEGGPHRQVDIPAEIADFTQFQRFS